MDINMTEIFFNIYTIHTCWQNVGIKLTINIPLLILYQSVHNKGFLSLYFFLLFLQLFSDFFFSFLQKSQFPYIFFQLLYSSLILRFRL